MCETGQYFVERGEREMADHTIYWKRLNLCAEIIRANGEITRLQLARKLTEKRMPCTPWTIDKIKPDILEMFEDIVYHKTQKKFFIKDNFSFSTLSPKEKEELK